MRVLSQLSGVNKIFEMVMAFNGETRYESLLNTILEKMMELTNSDAGTLYILEDGALHFRIIKNITLSIFKAYDDGIDLPPVLLEPTNIENVSAYAAIKNEIVVIDDVYKDNRFNFTGPKNYDKITGYRSRSMLVLPLTTYRSEKPEVMGVIQLMNVVDPKTGEPDIYRDIFEPPVIPALANIASNTLANLIHLNEIRMLFHSFAAAMARAIDERSAYNSNHTSNVTNFVQKFSEYLRAAFPLGHRLHFDAKRSEELAMAAILHDIGKIITPPDILDKSDKLGGRLLAVRDRFFIRKLQLENERMAGHLSGDEFEAKKRELERARLLVEETVVPSYLSDEKIAQLQKLSSLTYVNSEGKTLPILEARDIESLSVRKGTLTEGEREIMQEHVAITGRILESAAFSKYYKNVLNWASGHHEFIDGTGYPSQLKADKLPIETRILTILDIYEALTAADRPYKKPFSPEKSFAILKSMADEGKLDTELVTLFEQSNVWKSGDGK